MLLFQSLIIKVKETVEEITLLVQSHKIWPRNNQAKTKRWKFKMK